MATGTGRRHSGQQVLSGKSEYASAYRDGTSSPKDNLLTKNAADRIRRSDSGAGKGLERGGSGIPQSPLGTASPSKQQQQQQQAAKNKSASDAGQRAPTVGVFSLNRQSSDRAKQQKAALGMSDIPGSMRQGHRVPTYNSSAVAAALSRTMPSLGPGRGRPNGATSEQESQLGELSVGYGSSSFQGMRNYQEDTIAFLQGSSSLAGAVYDGHGGDQVSKELERVLLQNIMRGINELAARDQDCMGPSPGAIQAAISHAYCQTNHEIGLRLPASADAGSCAVTFVITRAAGVLHLFCANAGDCRAVLYTGPAGQKRAIRLTEDHKPHPQVCPSEITRVTNAGGCVLWGRVQGCLAVSRAFGDRTLHPYVIADPYVSVRPLNADQDAFLYLVSDGVTDMLDDNTGCQIVQEQLARGQSTAQAAAALVSAAYQQGSSDNISAIVVRLKRR